MATGWSKQVRIDFQKLATQVATTKTYTTPHAALCTVNPGDAGAANNTAGTTEPSSTGSYARQPITWNTIATPADDAAANATNNGNISWTSSAAYSTAANVLNHVAIYNTASLATVTEASYLGRAAIAVPQAVNAAGITLTMATGTGLVMGCISA